MNAKLHKHRPTIAALLTGRGGSTLKDKNVLLIQGKPLLYYAAKAARDSKLFDAYYVSSDDKKILVAGQRVGYKPIVRPKQLSRPDSQHGDVILHALDTMKSEGALPDIVVVILANSVTVKTKWIEDCVQLMLSDDSVTAVAPMYQDSDHHPFRAKKINRAGLCEPFFNFKGSKVSTNRQDLDPSYYFCHTFWVLRTKSVYSGKGQPPWIFMGNRIKPYVMKEPTFDVHEIEDLAHSAAWVRANISKK